MRGMQRYTKHFAAAWQSVDDDGKGWRRHGWMCVRENNWRSDTAQNECSGLPQKSQRERGPTHEKCPRGKARSLPKLKRRRFRRKSKLKWQRRRYRLPAPRFALLPSRKFLCGFCCCITCDRDMRANKNRKPGPQPPSPSDPPPGRPRRRGGTQMHRYARDIPLRRKNPAADRREAGTGPDRRATGPPSRQAWLTFRCVVLCL